MSDTPAPLGTTSAPQGTGMSAPTAAPVATAGTTSPPAAPSTPAATTPAAPKPAANALKPAANAPKTTPAAPITGANDLKTATNTPVVTTSSQQVAIKVLKAHPALGVFAGDTTKVPAHFAAELILSGHAAETTALVEAALAKPTDAQLVQAKAAYQRYGAVTDFKNYQGNPMPEFEALPEAIQCAWSAAANLEYSHKAE